MITKADYDEYFGANTAPSNFIRLEYLSMQIIKSLITKDVPKETDINYNDFKKAVIEQVNYFENNNDLLEDIMSAGNGYSIGKFSENSIGIKVSTTDNIKRLSPNTYIILLNAGYLYSGLC